MGSRRQGKGEGIAISEKNPCGGRPLNDVLWTARWSDGHGPGWHKGKVRQVSNEHYGRHLGGIEALSGPPIRGKRRNVGNGDPRRHYVDCFRKKRELIDKGLIEDL